MNEEKYIKDKLSDYKSPMDMDQMWSQLTSDLDSDGTTEDSDAEVNIEKEEGHIKDQLADYESPMEMAALWSKLDANLDAGKKSLAPTASVPEKQKVKRKLILFLILFLCLGGLAIYGLMKWNGNKVADNTSQVSPANGKEVGVTEKAKPENQYVNSQSAQAESSITADAPSNAITVGKNNKVAGVESNKSTNRKDQTNGNQSSKSGTTNYSEISNTARQSQTSGNNNVVNPSNAGTDKLYSSPSELINDILPPANKVSEKVEVKKPLAIILPVLNNSGGVILLDDQQVSLNPLAILERNSILPLPSKTESSYNPNLVDLPVKKSAWRIGIDAGFNRAKVGYNSETSNSVLPDTIYSPGSASSNFSFGINVEKVFNSGLKLNTGLNYLNQGSSFNNRELINTEVINEEVGDEILTFNMDNQVIRISEVEREVLNTYQISKDIFTVNSLQIPILVGYELALKKFDVSASVGIGVNFFFNNTNYLIDARINQGIKYRFNTTLSGLTEVQAGYRISDKFRIYSKFQGGRFMNEFLRSYPVTESSFSGYLNHYDLKLGISYLL